MSTQERRDRVHAWKERILANYLERGQLQVFDADGDNVFFVPDQLVVTERVAERVRPRLERFGGRPAAGTFRLQRASAEAGAAPVSRGAATVTRDVFDLDPRHKVNVAELALELSDAHGGGVAPNHLVTGLQRRIGWPDGDPEPAPAALPRLPQPVPDAGAGVTVAVIDTGFPSRLPPDLDWFASGCDHSTATGEIDEWGRPLRHVDRLDGDGDGYLDAEAGHGLFVAGIIRRMAPQAHLVFLKALNSDGMGTELGVANAIRYAVRRGVDVINLSLGFYTTRDSTPASMETAVVEANAAGAALVAAAGNDGLASPTYPAVFPYVIGVGSLAATGAGLADFSNRGPWVDVNAPGQEVQSSYVRGREDPTDTKDGGSDRFRSNTALWSGTSFACAHVSGYVAANLHRGGGSDGDTNGERAAALVAALPTMDGANRRLDPAPAF